MKKPEQILDTTADALVKLFPVAEDRPQTDWLLRYVRAGVVPYARKVGRNYLFDVDAVRKALQAKNIIP